MAQKKNVLDQKNNYWIFQGNWKEKSQSAFKKPNVIWQSKYFLRCYSFYVLDKQKICEHLNKY